MVGNDVVDLSDVDADPTTLSRRFDLRVFTASEKERIDSSADPVRFRWRFWAAKEAGYKLWKKQDGATIFSPRTFEVELDVPHHPFSPGLGQRPVLGLVRHAGAHAALAIDESEDWVHALVSDDVHGVRPVPRQCVFELAPKDLATPDGPSRAVRRRWQKDAGSVLGVANERLSIGRRERIPVPRLDGAELDLDLSFSHHGRFAAFAWTQRAASPVPHGISLIDDRKHGPVSAHGDLA
jgi:phosphopantetheinyl transferase (holo-ACP synthase)